MMKHSEKRWSAASGAITFKQLEAMQAVVARQGFAAAAAQLHTTQSAISKRIAELESALGQPLFDRSRRTARLTEAGERAAALAERLLRQRDEALALLGASAPARRRLSVGVTELTALTWLPRFVSGARARGDVDLQAVVEDSARLSARLAAGQIDMALLPDAFASARTLASPLGSVRNAWMCRPGLAGDPRRLAPADLLQWTLLVQGQDSGTGRAFQPWMHQHGLIGAETITTANLVAQVGLAVAGMGLAYLPRDCLAPLTEAGLLQILPVRPELPPVRYVALRRRGAQRDAMLEELAVLARRCCDFTTPFQRS